jgi:NAD(P)-dependent dehydrogenase (short-subunit alcohol dehydrogenase family)
MNRQKRLSYFKSKKILITGAGSGIGKATALQLAELGAYLIITDLNPDSLELTAVEARQLGAAVWIHMLSMFLIGMICKRWQSKCANNTAH